MTSTESSPSDLSSPPLLPPSSFSTRGASPAQRTADELLWVYLSPAILLLGLVGNLLVLVVINRKNLRGTTTCVYLTALAVFDTLALVAGIVPEWTGATGRPQFSAVSDFACQLEKFAFYTASDSAIWILVAFTLDRFVAVCFPLYKRSVCVPKRSRIACCLAFFLASVKNLHVFWTRSLVESGVAGDTKNSTSSSSSSSSSVRMACGKGARFKDFESTVRPWIAFATVSVLPFAVMAVCNAMIIYALARIGRSDFRGFENRARSAEREQRSGNLQESSGKREETSRCSIAVQEQSRINRNAESGSRDQSRRSKGAPSGQGKPKQASYRQTTMMCLSASIAFLVCVFPSIVMLIGKPYWSRNADGSTNQLYDVFKAVNNQLACLNHAINFFLYCLTGRKFRHELWLVLRACCPRCPSRGCRCFRGGYDVCSGCGCCKVFETSDSYDTALASKSSASGRWRGKLTSIFVTGGGGGGGRTTVESVSASRKVDPARQAAGAAGPAKTAADAVVTNGNVAEAHDTAAIAGSAATTSAAT